MVVEGKDEGSIAGGPVTRSPSGSLDAILCCVVRCLNVFPLESMWVSFGC